MSETEKTVSQIESDLWNMANKLRGNMDASEYKNYILAFMFYKYLSKKQFSYLVKQELITPKVGQAMEEVLMEEIFGTTDPKTIKECAVVSRNFTRLEVEKIDKNGQVEKDDDGKTIMVTVGKWVETYKEYLNEVASSIGYFISPYYSWENLRKLVANSEVVPSDYQAMFDAFNYSLGYNEEAEIDFRGIFNDVNLGDSRLGQDTSSRAKALGKIVELVSDISYTDESGKDILGHIYEYLINQFAASAGKKGGEFYTPHQVSKLMAKIVTSTKFVKENYQNQDFVFTVFDPTCGSGSLLLTVGKEMPSGKRQGAISYYGQELNTTTYNLARMNLMMNDVSYSNMHLKNADTLGRDWPDGPDPSGIDRPRWFDAVVANPPYSAEWDRPESYLKDKRFRAPGVLAPRKKADYAFVLDGLYHLNQFGLMAVVLPHGVLFRGASEAKIRETLIKNGNIDTIISLPVNLFYGASIPTIVMVLKKPQMDNMSKDIFFIDASKEFKKGKKRNELTDENIEKIMRTFKERRNVNKYAHLATFKEIEANEFNLNVSRYIDTSETEPEINLEDVDAKILELDQQIMQLDKEIQEMLKQLVRTEA